MTIVSLTSFGQSCDLQAKIEITSTIDQCEGNTSIVSIILSNGSGSYTVTVEKENGDTLFHQAGLGNGSYGIGVNKADTYTLTQAYDEIDDCNADKLNAVTIYKKPTGFLSGGGSICATNPGNAQATILISGGAAPYSIEYNSTTRGLIGISNYNNPQYIINTSTVEDLNWSGGSIVDKNGCQSQVSGLTGVAQIVAHDNPIVSEASIQLSCPNGPIGPNEFDVAFDITGGLGTGEYIVEVFDAGTTTPATFNSMSETNGSVVISGINENDTVDIHISDTKNCTPFILSNINFICSCPSSASLEPITSTDICNDGSKSTTLQLTASGSVGPFDFSISGIKNGVITSEASYVGTTFTIDVNDQDTYFISSFFDQANACESGVQGDIEVTEHALPTATISSTGNLTICDGELTDSLIVTFTGTAPYELCTEFDENQTTTSGINTNDYKLAGVGEEGSYTLCAVSDNYCEGTTSGSVEVIITPQPSGVMSGGGITCNKQDSPDVIVTMEGNGPFDLVYTLNGDPITINGANSPFKINNIPTSRGEYTYELSSLFDGCFAGPSNMTGSAVVVVDECVGISNLLTKNEALYIYPNPTPNSSTISIELPFGANHQLISIYNTRGQLVIQEAEAKTVQAPNENGLYIIKVIDNNMTVYTSSLHVE